MRQDTQDTLMKFKDFLGQSAYSRSTRTGYLTDVRLFFRWFEKIEGEGKLPQNITTEHIKEYQQYSLMVKQYTTNTIKRKLVSISILMEWAKRRGLVESNPVSRSNHADQQTEKAHYLSKEEQRTLRHALEKLLHLPGNHQSYPWLKTRRDASLVSFLLNTGLLPLEIRQLRVRDVKSSGQKKRVRINGRGRRQRKVPLNQTAQEALESWLTCRSEIQEDDILWVAIETEKKGLLNDQAIKQIVQKVGKDAGLEILTPYMLRHTFAKNLVDHGVGIEKVAALLGLESLDAARLYVTSDDQDLEEAVESIG